MIYNNLLFISLLLIACNGNNISNEPSPLELITIEQDYEDALAQSSKYDKLLFIDFYTSWCAPCKQLDTLVFRNDTISQKLGKDFVLLRYDAENDTTFHLSKKHHVNSYPTGLVLNSEGYVVNRQYGFKGDNTNDLSKSVFEFTNQSIELHQKGKTLQGYSNNIDISKYPQFYIDYVNRDDKKAKKRADFQAFWINQNDFLLEENFTTLAYFASDAPTDIADNFLQKKENFIALYGEKDVDIALTFFSMGKFDDAIASQNKVAFQEASSFAEEAIGKESATQLLTFFQLQFEEALSQ